MDELPTYQAMKDDLFSRAWVAGGERIESAGALIGVNPSTMWRWAVKKGLLPANKRGKQ